MVMDNLTIASFVCLVIYKLLVSINVNIMCASGVGKQASVAYISTNRVLGCATYPTYERHKL